MSNNTTNQTVAMSINMLARARTGPEHPMADRLDNQPIFVVRAITEPEPGVDAEALPLFRCVDDQGSRYNLNPEEVRTLKGEVDPNLAENPLVYVNGKAIIDLHPFVVETLNHQNTDTKNQEAK